MSDLTNALNSGGKRTRTHDKQMVIKLPTAAKLLISEEAVRQDVSDAAIVRAALAEYFDRRGL